MRDETNCTDGTGNNDASTVIATGASNGHQNGAESIAVNGSANIQLAGTSPQSTTTTNILLNGHYQNDQGATTGAVMREGSNLCDVNYGDQQHQQRVEDNQDGKGRHSSDSMEDCGDGGGGELISPTDSGVVSPSSTPDVMTPAAETSQRALGTGEPDEQSNNGQSSINNNSSADYGDDSGKQELVAATTNRSTASGDGTEEVVLIQDASFCIKIAAPGCEPFDLQVSSMELVQEIHQVLMDREETCFRTCFSLHLDGVPLDHFTELKNVEGLKDGVVLKVVEEAYTVREARIHLRHIRDLMKSLDPIDAYNGLDCSSLSFLNTITSGSTSERKQRFKLESSMDCTPPESIMPNSKERPLAPIMPTTKDPSIGASLKVLSLSGWNPPPGNRKLHGDLLYLYVLTVEDKRYHITCCTKGFYVNQSTEEEFNPKPANPKLMFHSLPELLNHLSPGFKKNFALIQKKRCQRHPFERVATPYQVHSWAVPAFEHKSDAIRAEDAFAFKLGYEEHIPGQTREWNEELQTTRELPRKTLPERLLRERAIFKVHSDFVAAASRGAVAVIDGNVMAINPGEDPKMQMFIWNNIFFSLGFDVKDHYKEFGGDAAAFVAPSSDLLGVKAYFNLDIEGLYVLGTAIIDYRGYRVTAQSIIPGILERDQEQSVVYGSIDFGKTVVSSAKYEELMEKSAQQLKILPHRVLSSSSDKEVKLYSSVESKGIIGNDSRHYILDLLRTFPPDVHYLGDVAAVTDISRENGYPRSHPHKFACLRQELVDAFAESQYITFIKIAAFHLQKLRVVKSNDSGKAEVEPSDQDKDKKSSSAQISGVADSDASTSARVACENGGSAEGSDNASTQQCTDVTDITAAATADGDSAGETKPDIMNQSATTMTKEESEQNKIVVDHLKRKLSRGVSPSSKEGSLPPEEEARKIMDSFNDDNSTAMENETKEIIRKAAQAVGSLSDEEYDIRFNPDCFSPLVTHAPEEEIEKQRRLVKEAAQFLLVSQIPNFIRDSLDHSFAPLDGSSLTDALHTRGINIRYLGKLTTFLEGLPTLQYLKMICVCELICRSAKHIFRNYLQNVEHCWLSLSVAHFLNCLLGSYALPQPSINEEMLLRKKSKSKKKNSTSSSAQDSTEWAQFTPKSLWQQICQDVDSYYGYQLAEDSADGLCETYELQKVSILRRFCTICGVQVLLKDYAFDSKTKATFAEDDMVNLFPVVKHINPRASDAYNFYTTGQAKIQQGQLKAGYDLVAEALNLLNNVYGAMHPEIAQCLRLLARLAYILGDHQEALANQHKAVLMSERCNGVDHPQTILEYTHLALYCFANLQVSTSLKLLYRARYLLLIAHGEDHPHMALLDSNIGLILHAVNEYDLSLRFLEHALKLHVRFYGRNSLKTALSYHLMVRVQSCRGDFRTALQYEKETFTVYKHMLGEDHEKTRESGDCLKHLTQQAVTFQKRMNEITRNSGSVSQLLPLQIQQPSLSSVLDVLNVISGIVFIQISPKEVEAIRAELAKSGYGSGNGVAASSSAPQITEVSDLD